MDFGGTKAKPSEGLGGDLEVEEGSEAVVGEASSAIVTECAQRRGLWQWRSVLAVADMTYRGS